MLSTARFIVEEDDATRLRLKRAGVALSDDEWDALPEPARRRLRSHPADTEDDRARLAALVRWLLWEFPPGWSRTGH